MSRHILELQSPLISALNLLDRSAHRAFASLAAQVDAFEDYEEDEKCEEDGAGDQAGFRGGAEDGVDGGWLGVWCGWGQLRILAGR